MATWLASIVGVVVVGVVVELLTQNRRMGNFIRSIYGFIVLFVIVSPLPKLLKMDWWSNQTDNLINTEILNHLMQNSKQTQIARKLRALGYEYAVVTTIDDVVYVNLGIAVDAVTLDELQKELGEGVIII